MKNKLIDKKIIAAIIWLIFTTSLTIWWIILGLRHIDEQKNMILLEGLTLIICIIVGGIFLLYFILSERGQKIKMQEFFAALNHEIKTYMASLRLKAEGLSEDLEGKEESKNAKGIVNDTVRLEIQLENSLFLSSSDSQNLFFQNIGLEDIIKSLKNNWPSISMTYPKDVYLSVDQRAFETIIKNIVQNACIHGKASEMTFDVKHSADKVIINISNNGGPFEGSLEKIATLFHRHSKTSRSGIGLYLAKKLAIKMGGHCHFTLDQKRNLITKLTFKKGQS